jgi:hypothetical protein
MEKYKKKINPLLYGIVLFLMIFGCKKSSPDTGSLYVPTSMDVTTKATLQELQDGRALYINNCGSCHQLYSPDNYSAAQWKSILSSMVPRTNLSSSNEILVDKYLSRGNP